MKLHRNAKTTPHMRALLVDRIRHRSVLHRRAALEFGPENLHADQAAGWDRSSLRLAARGSREVTYDLPVGSPQSRSFIIGRHVQGCKAGRPRAFGKRFKSLACCTNPRDGPGVDGHRGIEHHT